MRAVTGLPRETPVHVLLENSGFLSFHQMCAFSIIKLTHKILTSKQPVVLFKKIFEHQPSVERPRRQNNSQFKYKLSISRESLISQAAKLFYGLPQDLQSIENQHQFKKSARIWVQQNVPIYM